MVRLRKSLKEMGLYNNLTMAMNHSEEKQVVVAVLPGTICVDCVLNPAYNVFICKSDCIIQTCPAIDCLEVIANGNSYIFRFGSYDSQLTFWKEARDLPGSVAPPPSSATASPPSSISSSSPPSSISSSSPPSSISSSSPSSSPLPESLATNSD